MPLPPPGKKIPRRGDSDQEDHRVDYQQMVQDCTRQIEQDPHNYQAFYYRGIAYRRKGDHARAVKDFSEAIELRHRYPEALMERGYCYLALGHPDYAQRDFKEILKFEPKNPDAWNARGESLARTSEYDEAIRCFTRAIELNRKLSKAYFNRGEAYISKGQYAAACYNKGYGYFHQGKLDLALEQFSAGIKAEPDFELMYLGKAQTLEEMGLFQKAINEYKNVIRRASDPTEWHVDYARTLLNELLGRM